MPLPKPEKKEDQKQFMSRCLGDDGMKTEFKDIKQRIAVCLTTFRREKGIPEPKNKNA